MRDDPAGQKRLVACIVPSDQSAEEPLSRQALTQFLRESLKQRLPEHMVPTGWALLDHLPLTPSGKVNRRALLQGEWESAQSQAYVEPRTDLERMLAGIWQKILKLERVGVHDNFFDIGGHSLLASRVITHIAHELEVDLPLRVIFDRPTVEGLVDYLADQLADQSMEEVS
jgi:hypothetical protein